MLVEWINIKEIKPKNGRVYVGTEEDSGVVFFQMLDGSPVIVYQPGIGHMNRVVKITHWLSMPKEET